MKMKMTTTFRTELATNIDATISKEKRAGTTGMSLDNLKMVVPTPKTLIGAPQGTNARWAYAQMFEEVVNESPIRRKFIIRR